MRLYLPALVILLLVLFTDIWFYWYLFYYKQRLVRFMRTLCLYVGVAYFAFFVSIFLLNPVIIDIKCANTTVYFLCAITWFIIWYLPRIILFALNLISHILLFYVKDFRKRYIKPLNNIFIISIIGLILFSIFYSHNVLYERRYVVNNRHLGDSFDNYTIVQLSDTHLGSMPFSKARWQTFTERINALDPDLIVFTGDLVNNYWTETQGWDSVFAKLKAKNGKIAITGNHDYGDYSKWESPYSKYVNHQKILYFLRRNGFFVANNCNLKIGRNTDTLVVAGVENWGLPPFPQYGNLNAAVAGATDMPTILLTHDPDHWVSEVSHAYDNIFLTLSGHTHGMQFGLRNRFFNISPAALRYKYWGGLYQQSGRYLYVSTGLGFIGFMGRIGMWPEVSVFTLKRQ